MLGGLVNGAFRFPLFIRYCTALSLMPSFSLILFYLYSPGVLSYFPSSFGFYSTGKILPFAAPT